MYIFMVEKYIYSLYNVEDVRERIGFQMQMIGEFTQERITGTLGKVKEKHLWQEEQHAKEN